MRLFKISHPRLGTREVWGKDEEDIRKNQAEFNQPHIDDLRLWSFEEIEPEAEVDAQRQ